MKEPDWVSRELCLAIHDMMLSQHGGLDGIRDAGVLEAALAKPQNRFHYTKTTHPELAASYAAGIILGHPFLDGNKRTGFLVAATFLEMNHFEVITEEIQVVERTLALASKSIDEAAYAKWLASIINRNS